MLPPSNRLRAGRDFRRVYKAGRSYPDSCLVLYYLPRRSKDIRFGYSVSKKVGGAVCRNRIKRLLRESCWKLVPVLTPGFDAVIVARSRANGATLATLTQALEEQFRKAGALETVAEPELVECENSASS